MILCSNNLIITKGILHRPHKNCEHFVIDYTSVWHSCFIADTHSYITTTITLPSSVSVPVSVPSFCGLSRASVCIQGSARSKVSWLAAGIQYGRHCTNVHILSLYPPSRCWIPLHSLPLMLARLWERGNNLALFWTLPRVSLFCQPAPDVSPEYSRGRWDTWEGNSTWSSHSIPSQFTS